MSCLDQGVLSCNRKESNADGFSLKICSFGDVAQLTLLLGRQWELRIKAGTSPATDVGGSPVPACCLHTWRTAVSVLCETHAPQTWEEVDLSIVFLFMTPFNLRIIYKTLYT